MMASVPSNEKLLTLDELAARLQMHPDTVRGLKRRGVIPSIRIGHRTLRFEYQNVLDALRNAAKPPPTRRRKRAVAAFKASRVSRHD